MDDFYGYIQIPLSDEDYAALHEGGTDNSFGCAVNQYLQVLDENLEPTETYRWDGLKFHRVFPKSISSKTLGKINAKNPEQVMAIDMLYNHDITVKMLAGKFGSGKTFLMSSAAVDMLEHHQFDRIVYIRNNIEVKDSKPIGFLPGSYTDKLMPFAAPLADHLGGTMGLERMMQDRKIDVMHLGFIRGRDIKHSIIFCSEAENLTKEHIQLLISRVGEGSELWLDGDFKQKDAEIFVRNSGMSLAAERLTGHRRFGFVRLSKTERSETAAMADLLD